jgi:predicted nuclease with TOPRIM domain
MNLNDMIRPEDIDSLPTPYEVLKETLDATLREYNALLKEKRDKDREMEALTERLEDVQRRFSNQYLTIKEMERSTKP